jgi:glycosyltransferase involved in cell wall biosynthesis
MMIGVLIPTRGDRPGFIEQARVMIDYQTLRPDAVVVMDFPPEDNKPDITKRVRMGYDKLTEIGIDIVVIWEDDDYYHPGYLQLIHELFENGADLIGFDNTVYYHIGAKRYKRMNHNTHSSLFQTSIRAGLDIKWPYDDEVFLDIELWRNKHLKRELHRFESGCLGVKHGIGKTGGRGHNQQFYAGTPDNVRLFDDPEMKWLKEMTGEHFEFYKNILK